MSKVFRSVVEFNQKVLGLEPRPHGLQEYDEAHLSYMQLNEEASEYLGAYLDEDLVGCVDACIDSIVFAMGILYKMGIVEEEFDTIFEVVMAANMTKKIGVAKGREGFTSLDATKPLGFKSPEHIIKEILGQ
jgi:predicted HAD superfamily Cof-like phosphohydrolase